MKINSIIKEDEHNIISTKANTLRVLSSILIKSYIEDMKIFLSKDFFERKSEIIQEIKNQFKGSKIVVRSSSANEDCFTKSNAGHYTSILDIDSNDEVQIEKAITAVIESYKTDIEEVEIEQVLVQHQAVDVKYSGVLFTYDIQEKRPYYLINYDDTGITDSVTSGKGGKTLWIARNIDVNEIELSWRNLIYAVKEIEALLNIALDIEFAINNNDQVIIFQVRPLVANLSSDRNLAPVEFFEKIDNLKKQYTSYRSVIDGKNMHFSDMAFWNPSEIIGSNPRNLDFSLYKEIITNRAWNEGLVPMGYRQLQDDLMFQIGNKPYISLDYSFYTLIPQSIPEKLAVKLSKYYLHKLKNDITAHDKIEFEIAFTSYDFSTSNSIKELLSFGFSKDEIDLIKNELFAITKNAVITHQKVQEEDRRDLEKLNDYREKIENDIIDNQSFAVLIKYICNLLEKINSLGTPQFAREARMAFMARSFCSSLQSEGYFSSEEIDGFMKNIETVSSKFEADYQKFSNGSISRKRFNKKYGHLRSGTYDIRTDRYDQMVFKPVASKSTQKSKDGYKGLNIERVKSALDEIGLDLRAEEFNDFLSSSIEAREYFKFEFTKSLSLVLELIINVGKILEIKREDMSWLQVDDFKRVSKIITEGKYENDNLESFILNIKGEWNELINYRKKIYNDITDVILPDVITGVECIQVIPVNEARPNFITSKRVEGEVVLLEETNEYDLMDKIVVIPKADPGYEWIFTKGIKGFITKYGGVASHMAIRCAEFEIPAAIGCGNKIYDYVSNRNYIELDCENGKIGEGMQCQDLRAIITQREGVNQYGDPTDVLEAAYVRFYELLGFIPQPASNYIRNVSKLFEKKVDLLIVCGGGSLQPHYYDQPHSDELQPHRDEMEKKLIKHCIEQGIPIICTCRGMQYINVLFGGKLRYHPQLSIDRPRGKDHEIYLTKEDRTIWVNNFHKDVIPIDGLAPCFEPLAIDLENQTIEAFGSDEMKVLALQWHPERKFETSNSLQETRKIVVDFIQKHIQ